MADHFYIVTKNDCVWCDKAKALLSQEGYTYTEAPYDGSTMSKLLMLSHGLKTVPQVFEDNGDWIGGYSSLEGYLLGNYKS